MNKIFDDKLVKLIDNLDRVAERQDTILKNKRRKFWTISCKSRVNF